MIIDLSHVIEPGMPVFPGSQETVIEDLDLYDEYGVYVKAFAFDGHIGTHLDTPKHLFGDAPTTSSMDVSSFMGNGFVIDCLSFAPNAKISVDVLNQIDNFNGLNFIIIYTGWYKKWGSDEYFKNFPTISEEFAQSLADSNIKGIGLDNISIDPIDSEDIVNHKILLGSGKVIIENLTNLEKLVGRQFTFSCLPLNIKDGDGSPIRAVAIID